MQPHFHAIVWIDHHQAKVFQFNADQVDRTVVRPHASTLLNVSDRAAIEDSRRVR